MLQTVYAGILKKSIAAQGTQGFPQVYPTPLTGAEQSYDCFKFKGY